MPNVSWTYNSTKFLKEKLGVLIWFVIIYWVVSVGIGLWAALRVKNTADFAAAGHSLPMSIVTATVFATCFSF